MAEGDIINIEAFSNIGLDSLVLIGAAFAFIAIMAMVFLKKPKKKILMDCEIDLSDTVWLYYGEGEGVGYNASGIKAIHDSKTDSLREVYLRDGTVLPHVKLFSHTFVPQSLDLLRKGGSKLVLCRVDKTGIPRAWTMPPELKDKMQPSKMFQERMVKKIKADFLEGLRFKEKMQGSSEEAGGGGFPIRPPIERYE